MSAKTQAGYILLTEEIDKVALEIQKITDELANAQDQLHYEETQVLPANRARLASWRAAGNSDLANKLAKIAESESNLAATQLRIKALKKDIQEIGYELTQAQNLLKTLNSQRDAFERSYKKAIIEGKDPATANEDAEMAAQELDEKVNAAKAALASTMADNTKKYLLIGGGVLVLGLIIFLIVKVSKK